MTREAEGNQSEPEDGLMEGLEVLISTSGLRRVWENPRFRNRVCTVLVVWARAGSFAYLLFGRRRMIFETGAPKTHGCLAVLGSLKDRA